MSNAKLEIDLNSDMGEGFGAYSIGSDEEIIRYISSANIACGMHAGDPNWMEKTVKLAENFGVGIGAHPGLPDRQGFGRRHIEISVSEARNDVVYQIGALTAFTKNKSLQHVKIHGAMYNSAAYREDLGKAICRALLDVDKDMILVVLAGSPWVEWAKAMGVSVAEEVFADRAINHDGSLVSRSIAGAVISDLDEVVKRSIRMIVEGKAQTIDGQEISVNAETLSLHSDTPGSVNMAEGISVGLREAGVQIKPIREIVKS